MQKRAVELAIITMVSDYFYGSLIYTKALTDVDSDPQLVIAVTKHKKDEVIATSSPGIDRSQTSTTNTNPSTESLFSTQLVFSNTF